MDKGINVRVTTESGWVQGRNGLFDIRAVEAWGYPEDGTLIHLDAIGRRGKPINAGIALTPAAMDGLAFGWLKARGLLPDLPEESRRLMRPGQQYAVLAFDRGYLNEACDHLPDDINHEQMEQIAAKAEESLRESSRMWEHLWEALQYGVEEVLGVEFAYGFDPEEDVRVCSE